MHTKRITLRDVAEKLGVSHTTVGMALRNHHSISVQRREEVKRAAELMGYRPDPLLSALATYRQHLAPAKHKSSVAWITCWQTLEQKQILQALEYQAGILRGATEASSRFGYSLDQINWDAGLTAKRLEQILVVRGVRGVLLAPNRFQHPDWSGVNWGKFSVVRFGLSIPTPDSNLVTSDHFRAVVMAVQRIYDYGYQRIGLVIGDKYNRTLGGNTLGGFLYVQDLLNLKPSIPPLKTDFTKSDTAAKAAQKDALRKWLARHSPEAILTTDAEIPELLQELGHRIPNDIAVAGTTVYDIPVDAGIDQHAVAIGRIAMETLVKQMNISECGEPADPVRVLVESRWQDGKTLPPRRH